LVLTTAPTGDSTVKPIITTIDALIELGLERIRRIGPTTRQKLKAEGVETVLDLVVVLPKELIHRLTARPVWW
jgi:hypothetical protein